MFFMIFPVPAKYCVMIMGGDRVAVVDRAAAAASRTRRILAACSSAISI